MATSSGNVTVTGRLMRQEESGDVANEVALLSSSDTGFTGRLQGPVTNRDLLEAAGYVCYTQDGLWEHQISRRQIMAEITAALSLEKLTQWIAAGEGRKPPLRLKLF